MLLRKREFMKWEEYQQKMVMREVHEWQQATRKQSLKNALAQAAL